MAGICAVVAKYTSIVPSLTFFDGSVLSGCQRLASAGRGGFSSRNIAQDKQSDPA